MKEQQRKVAKDLVFGTPSLIQKVNTKYNVCMHAFKLFDKYVVRITIVLNHA